MKQFSLFLALAFLFSWRLSSQCTVGVPWCTGLNAIGNSDYLGGNSSSNNPLRIQTNGTTAITVLGTNQNVGVGIAFNPTFRLDVSEDINAGGTSTTTTSAYYLGTNRFLWHNGNVSRVYVGVGAGNATSNATDNTFVGNNAGNAVTTGVHNTFIGRSAGTANTTGFENVCIGYNAGNNITTGRHNTMLGAETEPTTNDLDYATAIGAYATVSANNSLVLGAIAGENFAPFSTNVGIGTTAPLERLHVSNAGSIRLDVSGQGESYMIGGDAVLWHNDEMTNIFVGVGAGANINGVGINNAFFGNNAGVSNTSGSQNTILGQRAGNYNTNASYNTFLGWEAGFNNNPTGSTTTQGRNNVFVGVVSGFNNTTGNNNVNVGSVSGFTNTTGSNNTFIGSEADAATAALTNATAIGANAQVSASNSMVLGSVNGINGATANTNVGIGTTAPAYPLHVNGTIAATQFLVLDKTQTKDLLALITDLQKEVEELKQKYRCLTETHFVTNETR